MRKSLIVVLALSAVGAAYCVGYWPSRQARVAAELALETTQASLKRTEAHNRLYSLQSKLVDLGATVEAKNFGDAQGKATVFFDAVRTEASQPDQGHAKGELDGILAERDAVTSALSRSDTATLDLLRGVMARLREALGEPLSSVPAPTGRERSVPPLT